MRVSPTNWTLLRYPVPRVDERDRTRRLGTMLHSYLRQLRLLRDSNPGHIGWRGGLSPLCYSYASLSTLSGLSTSSLTGDQRNRASVKSSPATRMDKLGTESLHGRRLKEKGELRWALAKTREGKCGTHIFFSPSGDASSCVRRFHARFRPVYYYGLGKRKDFSWSGNPVDQ